LKNQDNDDETSKIEQSLPSVNGIAEIVSD
jgi:hypothetical protein